MLKGLCSYEHLGGISGLSLGLSRINGGVEPLPVRGHLSGGELMVKPPCKRSIFCFGQGGNIERTHAPGQVARVVGATESFRHW